VPLLKRSLAPPAVLGLTLSLALALLPAAAARAAERAFAEHEVEAAFLYNFAKFVEWPAEAFADPAAPLVLCVHGEDPFGPFLDRLVAGETVGGRRLEVDRGRAAGALAGCHLLFVARSEQPRFATLLAPLRRTSVLTVSDAPGFLEAGGLIRFVREGSKVRFEVNLPELARARLQVSSKLLRVARPAPRPGGGGAER
jgi:hypothetical protein